MAFSAVALAAAVAFGAEVKVDFNAEKGPVKPVNAVGQPPGHDGI